MLMGKPLISTAAEVIRRFDVVNRGLSGYNTSQTLQILPELFPAPVPGGPKLEYLVSIIIYYCYLLLLLLLSLLGLLLSSSRGGLRSWQATFLTPV